MSDLPILFSAPMVRAILREIERLGTGKTQTRRIIKRARTFATPETRAFTLAGDNLMRALQNASDFRHLGKDDWSWESDAFEWQAPATRTKWLAHLGYAPGDRLWVREAWSFGADHCWSVPDVQRMRNMVKVDLFYRADPAEMNRACDRWFPSIHMPRWASRLTLIVTDVRVQRLQDISDEDAIAEGLTDLGGGAAISDLSRKCLASTGRLCFSDLWDTINGPGAWDRNPWVAAYTFDPVLCNIDHMERSTHG